MAKMNYEHVFSSAGFSGESFNIAEGYNVSYDTSAGDVVFDNATSTLILTTGTWPTWIREVGKEFVISGTTNNNGTFHTVSVDNTFKVLTVIESVVDETPVGVTSFDGSIDTGIIDVLLGVGNAVLTTDAPLVLHSTGALGAARTLDISALEIENVAQGGEPLNGRFFYLSIQNSDISSTNKITISSSSTINGFADLEITSTGDYMFFHESAGAWRVNILPRPEEALATLTRIPFTADMWADGIKNEITILQTGTPSAGQAGPHYLTKADTYVVQIVNTDLDPVEVVDLEVQFDSSTGNITLVKAQRAKAFNGIATIVGALD